MNPQKDKRFNNPHILVRKHKSCTITVLPVSANLFSRAPLVQISTLALNGMDSFLSLIRAVNQQQWQKAKMKVLILSNTLSVARSVCISQDD